MKRTLVIFPVTAAPPDWFVYPIPVSKDGTAPATGYAALMLGNVPANDGVEAEVRPTDTIRAALERAGFARVTKGTAVRPSFVPAPKPPGLWGRVKGFFRRGQ